jgi:DNA-binding GntR family transcriptional regulator
MTAFPVRDALKKLEIEELIASDSTQGAIVKKMELDECLDTLEMLEWLRTTAIDMLMGRISRSILMMLEANTRKGESLTDPKQQYENNAEFHELLIKATGNSVLYSISKRLQFKEKIIVNNILPYHYSDDYVLHHRNLLKAIINNNTEYVRQYAESNKEKANDYMNQLISKFLE